MIEEDLVAFVKARNLADGRIDPLVLPQKPTLPMLVYQKISTQRTATQSGPVDKAKPRIQFSCWDSTYSGSKQLAQALRLAINGFKGTMNGREICSAFVVNELDDYDAEAGRYRVISDVVIAHAEEVS